MGKTSIKNQTAMLIGAVMVLLVALALGMGIRKLRLEGVLSRPETQMQTHTIEPEAVVAAEAPPDLSEEDEQFLMWLEEETHTVEPEAVVAAETPPGLSEEDEQFIAWLEEEAESAAAQAESVAEKEYEKTAESIERPTPAAGFQQSQATQGFGDWRNAWEDLNLTEEEQTRLREGFRLAVEK